ncbi:DMT family transporter [Desulfovibrionales bacterium]
MTQVNKGYIMALLSALFLSTTSVFIRYLVTTYDIPPLVLAWWRNVFAIATLVPILWVWDRRLLRPALHHLPFLAGFGCILGFFNGLWALSVTYNGAAVATVMVYCSTAYTVILGWKFFGERLGAAQFGAVLLCLSGCILISGALDPHAWHVNVLGIVVGLLTGLCYTGYSLMGRTAAGRGISPWTTLLYSFCFALLFLSLTNMTCGVLPGSARSIQDFLWLGDAVAGWLVLVALGAIPTVAGYGFYNVSLGILNASVANIIVSLEPAFTAFFAYAVLREVMNLEQSAGALLVLTGVVVIKVADLRAAPVRFLSRDTERGA